MRLWEQLILCLKMYTNKVSSYEEVNKKGNNSFLLTIKLLLFPLFTCKFLFLLCLRATFPLNLFFNALNTRVLSSSASCCSLLTTQFFHYYMTACACRKLNSIAGLCLREGSMCEFRQIGSIRKGRDRAAVVRTH